MIRSPYCRQVSLWAVAFRSSSRAASFRAAPLPPVLHQLHQGLAPLLLMGEALLLRVEAVQQLRKALLRLLPESAAVLPDGAAVEVKGNVVAQEQRGLRLLLPQGRESGPELVGGGLPQAHVALPGSQGRQFPGQQRRDPREGLHQPFVGLLIPPAPGKGLRKRLLRGLEQVRFLLGGRQSIKQSGQQGTFRRSHGVCLMQAVQDPACAVHQDDIGVPPHQLHGQELFRGLPQLIQACKPKEHHPFPIGLLHAEEPGAAQVLSQEHAEHGRLRRVFPVHPGQVHPGGAAPGADQQAHRPGAAPQMKEQHIPLRLLHLVHPAARKGLQLPRHFRYTQRVQRHQFSSTIAANRTFSRSRLFIR